MITDARKHIREGYTGLMRLAAEIPHLEIEAKGKGIPRIFNCSIDLRTLTEVTDMFIPFFGERLKFLVCLPEHYPHQRPVCEFSEEEGYVLPFHPHFEIFTNPEAGDVLDATLSALKRGELFSFLGDVFQDSEAYRETLGRKAVWTDYQNYNAEEPLDRFVLRMLRSLQFEHDCINPDTYYIGNHRALAAYLHIREESPELFPCDFLIGAELRRFEIEHGALPEGSKKRFTLKNTESPSEKERFRLNRIKNIREKNSSEDK